MKRLAVLGSTGSIGTSTLRVVEAAPERFRVVALAAGRNLDLLLDQARRFRPGLVAIGDQASAQVLERELKGSPTRVASGAAGLDAVAAESGADLVVAALVGAVGLRPTLRALERGIDVALANKETLVMAGEVMTRAAAASGARILPIDSEHAALHQLLDHRPPEHVRRLVLTASGGPFRAASEAELAGATVEQALRHPTWAMGDKITIDSATLANKALEVIEARWLFGLPAERIDVLVHPQSLVHALIEIADGTLLAQLSVNDMRLPIQYALDYPARHPSQLPTLDLARLGRLDFEPPDRQRFPCLGLGFAAAAQGGTAPCVFNAANEVANAAFRAGQVDFPGIAAVVRSALEAIPAAATPDLAYILDSDARARAHARRVIEERSP